MKTWFITGASRGFGTLVTAFAFAFTRGDNVVATGRDPRAILERQGDHREDWVQRFVADGRATGILPERSATDRGLVTRRAEDFVLEREVVIATVSGSTAPVQPRKIAQFAARYDWNWAPGSADLTGYRNHTLNVLVKLTARCDSQSNARVSNGYLTVSELIMAVRLVLFVRFKQTRWM